MKDWRTLVGTMGNNEFTRQMICEMEAVREDGPEGQSSGDVMTDALRSNWTVSQVLAVLPRVHRVDDGCDLLACRVAGLHPSRTVYIYLYGDDPAVIWFDLEDVATETGAWDHAVQRGETRSLAGLREIVTGWLDTTPRLRK